MKVILWRISGVISLLGSIGCFVAMIVTVNEKSVNITNYPVVVLLFILPIIAIYFIITSLSSNSLWSKSRKIALQNEILKLEIEQQKLKVEKQKLNDE